MLLLRLWQLSSSWRGNWKFGESSRQLPRSRRSLDTRPDFAAFSFPRFLPAPWWPYWMPAVWRWFRLLVLTFRCGSFGFAFDIFHMHSEVWELFRLEYSGRLERVKSYIIHAKLFWISDNLVTGEFKLFSMTSQSRERVSIQGRMSCWYV